MMTMTRSATVVVMMMMCGLLYGAVSKRAIWRRMFGLFMDSKTYVKKAVVS
jgi:hypothetical protein